MYKISKQRKRFVFKIISKVNSPVKEEGLAAGGWEGVIRQATAWIIANQQFFFITLRYVV